MKIKYLLKGLVKNIPGIEKLYNFHAATGGTNNARYCYSVWLRHLILANQNGFKGVPGRVVELGPGDSLGISLSALLSGADKCMALDIVKYAKVESTLEIFDELITLFRNRTPVPMDESFANIQPVLNDYSFPAHILTDEILKESLDPRRLERIRQSIRQSAVDNPVRTAECMLCYHVPWTKDDVIEPGSIDMVISQAVLQHIDGVESTYSSMNKWLKNGGFMSHCIDLKSMGTSDCWYGHWTYNSLEWQIVKGRKKYLINRLPYSRHIEMTRENGFQINTELQVKAEQAKREAIASEFSYLEEKDLSISNVFLQAKKISMLFYFQLAAELTELSVAFEMEYMALQVA